MAAWAGWGARKFSKRKSPCESSIFRLGSGFTETCRQASALLRCIKKIVHKSNFLRLSRLILGIFVLTALAHWVFFLCFGVQVLDSCGIFAVFHNFCG